MNFYKPCPAFSMLNGKNGQGFLFGVIGLGVKLYFI
ncbi:MAG: hypothetical protein ACI815_000890 [Psychroserpens sp.]|jgi:hypothetical protein